MGKYDHLLAPIMVGNHLFKNRIIMTPTTPQYHQEDETYPAENLMQHYLLRAKNGAALITLSGLYPFDEDNPIPFPMRDYFQFDINKGENHYLAQLIEGIHGFGSFATIQVQHMYAKDYDICAGAVPFGASFMGDVSPATHQLSEADLKASTEQLVEKCLVLKNAGLDGVFLHMSYQQTVLGRSLSPLINHRTDQYGGSFENRLRLLTETCQAIKDACGKDFLIEAHITGEERDAHNELIPGGWSAEDSKNLAEAMSGLLDILHLRGWSVDEQHPTWLTKDEPPYLYLAEKCMEAVTETKILTTSGHKNPDMMDAVISEGKADFIGVARSLIADPNFVEKLYEDRADDICPCIRCNKCFEVGPEGTPRTNRCSVNPLWGFESRERILFPPSDNSKRVAVVGGGPAGMEAAITCKRRGHEVTLFEKSDALGGQLKIADCTPRKWAIRDYKDYLVHQVDKLGITVCLNTECTVEDIERGDFDVVFAALGSRPKIPAIPGIDEVDYTTILDVYGHEEELGQKVVIIGGGTSAIETGMHLAEECSREVTVLGRNAVLGKDMPPTHYRTLIEAEWAATPNLSTKTRVSVRSVSKDGVTYIDSEGGEKFVAADSIIVSVGMASLSDEAMKFHGHGARLIVIGDDRIPGSIMHESRDAFFAAAQI